jgi:type II secretory pathway component PulM
MKPRLNERWQALSPREKTGLQAALLLLLSALVWLVFLKPSLAAWQNHAKEWAALEQQRQQMAALQSQAQALQKRTPLSREEALKSLQALTRSAMPSAQVAAQNERVSVSFKAASATVLASWLQSARENAQVRVVDAQWQRTPEGLWEGAMVLKLPSRNAQP